MIYIASPYSVKSEDPDLVSRIKEERFRLAVEYNAKCFQQGKLAYSPIAHCHPIAIAHDLPGSFEFWRDFNLYMLNNSTEMHVLQIEGWDQSIGVAGEITHAADHLKIPILYISY